MKLLLDIGNTSAKVAIAEGDEIVHFEHREESWYELFRRLTADFKIDSCVVSNVAGVDKQLLHVIEMQPFPVIWLTYNTPCPVKPECIAPRGLGADRWAADIGAMSMFPDDTLLVVDAGTCITYDLISPEGQFIGGNISPGVELRLKAMHEHTALLPLIDVEGETPFMGYDTETAMRSGAVVGAGLEIEGFVRRVLEKYPNVKIFVTGGNHFTFGDDVKDKIIVDHMLIFRGLIKVI
ncbi:MAG: type III pantothenate kinase [Bacteroidaceae bacterium]|nr:type III pantothenate kinase [Bacteroidaceae bacterium]